MAAAREARATHAAFRADRTLSLPDGTTIYPDMGGAGWVLAIPSRPNRYYGDPQVAWTRWQELTQATTEMPPILAEWATHWPIRRQTDQKGRFQPHPGQGCGLLTLDQVREMRSNGCTAFEIAALAGVTESTVRVFCSRRGMVGPHGGDRRSGRANAE
jgi:hypothetical protein